MPDDQLTIAFAEQTSALALHVIVCWQKVWLVGHLFPQGVSSVVLLPFLASNPAVESTVQAVPLVWQPLLRGQYSFEDSQSSLLILSTSVRNEAKVAFTKALHALYLTSQNFAVLSTRVLHLKAFSGHGNFLVSLYLHGW